jgi:hypothetical protein
MKILAIGLVMVGGMLATGCESAPAEREYPMIVTLVGRHQTIEIRKGPEGPLYTVRNAAGEVLAENETLPALQAKRPEIYQQIKTLQADSRIDASMHPD